MPTRDNYVLNHLLEWPTCSGSGCSMNASNEEPRQIGLKMRGDVANPKERQVS